MEPVIEFVAEGYDSLYACGQCRMIVVNRLVPISDGAEPGDRELAILCCWCTRCLAAPRKGHRSVCEDCEKLQRQETNAARHAKLLAMPFAEPAGYEMFFADEINRFGEDLDTLADYILFDVEDGGGTYADIDWSDQVVHPCSKRQVGTPDVLEHLDEAWSSEFTDDSGPYLPSEAARQQAKLLQALLEKDAPIIYEPITTLRIDMAASQAGRPGNKGSATAG